MDGKEPTPRVIIKLCKFCQKEFECGPSTPNKAFCSKDCSKAFYRNKYVETYRKQEVWSEIRCCAYCGKEFEWHSNKAHQKYCCNDCSVNANKAKLKQEVWSETRACAHCGKEFEWYSNKANQKYCSRKCAADANSLKQEVWSEIRCCAYCGKEFEWFSNRASQKYCSNECSLKVTREMLKQAKSEVWSEIRKCAHCGKEFEWVSNKSSQKYCSVGCRNEAARIKVKGYQKGNNKTDELLRNEVYLRVLDIISKMDRTKGNAFNGTYVDYSVIGDISEKTRETVLQRDGYECQVCRRKDTLHLHHLIKRRYGGTHDAENLVTLCASCHRHIETGDIVHATAKCFTNAKRYYYDGIETSKTVDIDGLRDKLTILFGKLKESSVGEDSEIMVCLDEALDLLDP